MSIAAARAGMQPPCAALRGEGALAGRQNQRRAPAVRVLGRRDRQQLATLRRPAGQAWIQRGHRYRPAVHVGCAAAVEPPFAALARERVDGPALALARHTDGVDMRREHQRGASAAASSTVTIFTKSTDATISESSKSSKAD
ncbi:hypothetical protein NDN95_11510 [Burkholderia glumae]|nr:hypothetical protein [Burkholderia glumae]MCM2492753.1 hypothetical protein [Burkholderia glumae]MCM2544558.1 hypothetical protein [Burkholderia glumae]